MKITKTEKVTDRQIRERLQQAEGLKYPLSDDRHLLDGRMAAAVFTIDRYFGDGYAERHPELVGQCLIAMATSDIACAGIIEEAGKTVAYAINDLADAIKCSFHPNPDNDADE